MNIKIMMTMLVAVFIAATESSAFDYYGATVIDRDAPSSYMKYRIHGFHATITEVSRGSFAHKLGFEQGDIIISINGKNVKKTSELKTFTADLLKVLIFRASERTTLSINRFDIEKEMAARVATRSAVATLMLDTDEIPDGNKALKFDDAALEKKYGKSIYAFDYDKYRKGIQAQAVSKSLPKNRKVGGAPVQRVRQYSSSYCEPGHWVESVLNGGQIVKLEDGSIWEIDAFDTIDSSLWLPTTDIIICDDKLINTDDNETVSATRIR